MTADDGRVRSVPLHPIPLRLVSSANAPRRGDGVVEPLPSREASRAVSPNPDPLRTRCSALLPRRRRKSGRASGSEHTRHPYRPVARSCLGIKSTGSASSSRSRSSSRSYLGVRSAHRRRQRRIFASGFLIRINPSIDHGVVERGWYYY